MSAVSSTGVGESYLYTQNELYYHYQPSEAFAIVACVVFFVLTVVLTLQTLRYRQWFTSILAIGSALEFVGYLLRTLVTQTWDKDLFIIHYVFILVTPNFFAFVRDSPHPHSLTNHSSHPDPTPPLTSAPPVCACVAQVNYSAVGRLLPSLPTKPRAPTCLRIPIITDATGIFIPTRIAKFFFISDIVAFFIQASAAAFLTSSSSSTVKTGQSIVEVGLAWGLAFIALFFFVTLYVYLSPTYETRAHPDLHSIRRMYISLTVTITLLLVRSIYRMVEYVTGNTGYVGEHEWTFGVFDTLMMALACLMYCIWPYGKYLPQIHLPGTTLGGKTGKEQANGVEMERMPGSPMSPEGHTAVVMVHGADD